MNRAEPSRMALEHHSEAGETLADLGEWELIRRLGAFAPPGQFTDDAALLDASPASADQSDGGGDREATTCVTGGRVLVVNTDVLVEGLHFSDATTSPADVGWRAAAANLSDLAAMGTTEVVGITVGLVAPSHTAWSWVEGVYQGLHEALRTHGGLLLGGDCSGGTQRLLAITALGRLAQGGGPIRRGDGRPGDRLVSTGPHGLSRLGLALLQGDLTPGIPPGASARWNGARANDGGRAAAASMRQSTTTEASLPEALIRQAINAHRRPVPRFDAVRTLIGCRPVGSPWRLGGCDSSDGLAAAARAIALASGCEARLERAWLPLEPAMATLPEAEAWCLGGGEDFELVLALERSWSDALIQALPGSTVIGELIAGTAGRLSWTDGGPCLDDTPGAGGFQHFH